MASALIFPLVAQGHWQVPPPEALVAQACLLSAPVVTLGLCTVLVLRGKRKLVPVVACGLLILILLGGFLAFVSFVLPE